MQKKPSKQRTAGVVSRVALALSLAAVLGGLIVFLAAVVTWDDRLLGQAIGAFVWAGLMLVVVVLAEGAASA